MGGRSTLSSRFLARARMLSRRHRLSTHPLSPLHTFCLRGRAFTHLSRRCGALRLHAVHSCCYLVPPARFAAAFADVLPLRHHSTPPRAASAQLSWPRHADPLLPAANMSCCRPSSERCYFVPRGRWRCYLGAVRSYGSACRPPPQNSDRKSATPLPHALAAPPSRESVRIPPHLRGQHVISLL
jgi:hypothetical protein